MIYYILFTSVILSIGISFFCSLMESAFYAVSMPYIQSEAQKGVGSAKLLLKLKQDVGKPISAILILNTIANTAGASVSGWAVAKAFGASSLLPFSILYTLSILCFSEICPKMIGVLYSKTVTKYTAYPLNFMIKVFYPLILTCEYITKKINKGKKTKDTISPQEVISMAEMGKEEGSLDYLEGEVIENIIDLDKILVKTVMTPRTVVIRFEESATLGEILPKLEKLAFSRIPLYSASDPDTLTSYVTQRDMLMELVRGNKHKKLKEISRPLKSVPDLMRVDILLLDIFNSNEHLYAVTDEYGTLAGIITLEDVIEQIIGHEIVDEYDAVSNLRSVARLLRYKKYQSQNGVGNK